MKQNICTHSKWLSTKHVQITKEKTVTEYGEAGRPYYYKEISIHTRLTGFYHRLLGRIHWEGQTCLLVFLPKRHNFI
jgi:hypothetical protein